jgi:hypothetical protein
MGKGRAGSLQMPQYKVYVLRDDGQAINRVNLFCYGEERAKKWAKGLVDRNPIELWEGSTRIERFDPTH